MDSNDNASQYVVPAVLRPRLNAWLASQGYSWEPDPLAVDGEERPRTYPGHGLLDADRG